MFVREPVPAHEMGQAQMRLSVGHAIVKPSVYRMTGQVMPHPYHVYIFLSPACDVVKVQALALKSNDMAFFWSNP